MQDKHFVKELNFILD